MSDTYPIELPGSFAPGSAIGYDDGVGSYVPVGQSTPLPTYSTAAPGTPAPLTGSSATELVAGPFTPAPLAPVYCAFTGDWTGTIRLLRSTDGGVTRLPVTVGGGEWGLFTGNACEPVWQESEVGASLWLDIRPTSGTVTYRVSQ